METFPLLTIFGGVALLIFGVRYLRIIAGQVVGCRRVTLEVLVVGYQVPVERVPGGGVSAGDVPGAGKAVNITVRRRVRPVRVLVVHPKEEAFISHPSQPV